MIKIKGKIKYRDEDFYILQVSSGDCLIIESSDELEMDDVISWDDYDNFSNVTRNYDMYGAGVQSDTMSFQNAINTLKIWKY